MNYGQHLEHRSVIKTLWHAHLSLRVNLDPFKSGSFKSGSSKAALRQCFEHIAKVMRAAII
eukprot:843643-Pelagomonas_calceolata.AAC.2